MEITPSDARSVSELLTFADQLMYEEKKGRPTTRL